MGPHYAAEWERRDPETAAATPIETRADVS
jgi:hypothetical protein